MSGGARIGPNAILQLVPVLDGVIGEQARHGLFHEAGVALPPADAGMLPEGEVAALHGAVAFWLPSLVPEVMAKAGRGTADYILAHRIPALAQRMIRALPAPLAARVLAGAIARHAWTFAGSGVFAVERFGPLTLSITGNPLAGAQGCHWHAAVFRRLFEALVWPEVEVVERCCSGHGAGCCRFELGRKGA